MESCKCGIKAVINITAKCKDLCIVHFNNMEVHEGYAMGSEIGLDNNSGGDYIEFTYCGNCGQILNGNFPVPRPYPWEREEDEC